MARSKLLMLSMPAVHGGQAVTPWYLAGGVAKATCLAAYQAIGAASLAESYVNLANPGTYNLSGGVAPTWAAETGWTFDGSSQYKLTGITPAAGAAQTMSMIARFSGVTGNTGYIMGYTNGAAGYFTMTPRRSGLRRYWNGTGVSDYAAVYDLGVIAIAGDSGFYNGENQVIIAPNSVNGAQIAIGALTGPTLYFGGNIQAAAIYDTVLTDAQVLAISNAMEQLPNAYDASNPAYPGPNPPLAGEFTIAWFSDPHVGTWVEQSEMPIMTAWLDKNQARHNIQAVLFGGDYQDSPDQSADRAVFVDAMASLVDIPHLLAIGNHDYDLSPARNATTHNGVFGQSYYTGKSWWSGGFFEAGHAENAYLLLTIGAVNYIIISLEFFPREAVIDWADALLTTYAARKAIIITHAYEYTDNTPYSVGDSFGPDGENEAITDSDYHWGDEIWAELLNIHDNVILVHSGHVTPFAKHVTNSAGGQAVNQVLQNFQGGSGYENSMIRFMRFNPTSETIYVETFSPVTLTKSATGSNQFTLTY